MLMDFEEWLLNVMCAAIQVVHVIELIFSVRFSISVMLFASQEFFQNQSFKVKYGFFWKYFKILMWNVISQNRIQ